MSGPTTTVPTLAPLTSSTRSQDALRCLKAGNSASRGGLRSSMKSYFEKITFPKPVPTPIVLPLNERCSGHRLLLALATFIEECVVCALMLTWKHSHSCKTAFYMLVSAHL